MTTFNLSNNDDTFNDDDNGNTINGLGGNDVINGHGGDDIIDGGAGSDALTGGSGVDRLTGGTGADFFLDNSAGLNGDHITDFLLSDRIQITDLNASTSSISLAGSVLSYSDLSGHSGTVNIDNVGPGRLVVRAINGGGVEVRLQQDAHNDFNGDGRSDLFWRYDDGYLTDWLGVNGSFSGNWNNFNTNPGSNWHVIGTGDFNADGRVDVLWRDDIYGTITDWFGTANGGFVGNWGNLHTTLPTGMTVVGIGDFNGDALDDLLLRNNSSGGIVEWSGQANGSFALNNQAVNPEPGTSWQVAGTGDFNGDGLQDVLWRNQDGTVTDWLGTSSGTFSGNWEAVHTNPGSNWHVVGTGDFNGDGQTDVLWRDDIYGTVTDWLGSTNGTFSGNWDNLHAALPINSVIVSIGDFNGDAIDDLLMRNKSSGDLSEWLGQVNGGFAVNAQFANPNPGAGWHVQDPFVHDPFA